MTAWRGRLWRVIGGSQREDDYELLRQRIEEEKLPMDAYGCLTYGSTGRSYIPA
jgi:aspartyl/asparaginyl-tRNA synthetase